MSEKIKNGIPSLLLSKKQLKGYLNLLKENKVDVVSIPLEQFLSNDFVERTIDDVIAGAFANAKETRQEFLFRMGKEIKETLGFE